MTRATAIWNGKGRANYDTTLWPTKEMLLLQHNFLTPFPPFNHPVLAETDSFETVEGNIYVCTDASFFDMLA